MGGTIFTKPKGDEPALSCPRMPPATYHETRERCAAVLHRFFAHVATPPEAPSKPDYGDVDFHVFGSPDGTPVTPATFKQLLPQIKDALGAARMERSGDESVSYAVPWATTGNQHDADEPTNPADHNDADTKRLRLSPPELGAQHHAQVDVILCASLPDFHWTTWLHAYGDVSQILAISLRPLGLVFHPHGFVLRDPAIQRLDHYTPVGPVPSKRTMADTLLSNDPATVMRFLGLDVPRYEAGFEHEAALFDWLGKGRFIYRDTYLRSDGDSDNTPAAPADGTQQTPSSDAEKQPDAAPAPTPADSPGPGPAAPAPTETQSPAAHLPDAAAQPNPQTSRSRASDRRRRHTRPMFARFIDAYLASHAEIGASAPAPRDAVLDEAAAFFGRREERAARLADVVAAQAEARFWTRVRERVPKTGSSLREVVRGLRRWVAFQGGVPFLAGVPELDEGRVPRWTVVSGLCEEELLGWVDAHWEEAKALERERTNLEQGARKAAKAVDGR